MSIGCLGFLCGFQCPYTWKVFCLPLSPLTECLEHIYCYLFSPDPHSFASHNRQGPRCGHPGPASTSLAALRLWELPASCLGRGPCRQPGAAAPSQCPCAAASPGPSPMKRTTETSCRITFVLLWALTGLGEPGVLLPYRLHLWFLRGSLGRSCAMRVSGPCSDTVIPGDMGPSLGARTVLARGWAGQAQGRGRTPSSPGLPWPHSSGVTMYLGLHGRAACC